ncbi:reverse transcriptase-like protein [Thermanaerosceptrum fracticalcis]|uniref:reverse transcriptase-like protein n=1 Tax=Thermanaerosceptrum fracticalcis TaxID=1712410 RepID=UPI0023EE92F4|nr:reverse transcriptase-like protein [Thermanaerosceptrum fracticalcis]
MNCFFDGASSGNPGPAGIGAIILDKGEKIWEISRYIGEKTNNEAEYIALIELLKELQRRGIESCRIFGDSQLVINQVTGNWRINYHHLYKLWAQVHDLLKEGHQLEWVPREENKLADKLSTQAIAKKITEKTEPANNERLFRAKELAPGIFLVPSSRNIQTAYVVDLNNGACTCPAFISGKKRPCKHFIAISAGREMVTT